MTRPEKHVLTDMAYFFHEKHEISNSFSEFKFEAKKTPNSSINICVMSPISAKRRDWFFETEEIHSKIHMENNDIQQSTIIPVSSSR